MARWSRCRRLGVAGMGLQRETSRIGRLPHGPERVSGDPAARRPRRAEGFFAIDYLRVAMGCRGSYDTLSSRVVLTFVPYR